MKIIVSHDVDHIGGWCHWWRDFYWEKFLIKTLIFFMTRKIDGHLFLQRLCYVFTRRIENIDLLMNYNRTHNVPATFFVGVNRALGMSYSLRDAQKIVRRIIEGGFNVGVHGVAFDGQEKIKAEHMRFATFCRQDSKVKFGVRNHYLRGRENRVVHEWQDIAGYAFDSTDYGLEKPYKVGNLWEFPLSLMNSYLLDDCSNDMSMIRKKTLQQLALAEDAGLSYFVVLFHNPSRIFPDDWEWYQWFIEYLKKNDYEFVSFDSAIKELEAGQ